MSTTNDKHGRLIKGIFIFIGIGALVGWLLLEFIEQPQTDDFVCRATATQLPEGVEDVNALRRRCLNRKLRTDGDCAAFVRTELAQTCSAIMARHHRDICSRDEDQDMIRVGDEIFAGLQSKPGFTTGKSAWVERVGQRLVEALDSPRCFLGAYTFLTYDDSEEGSVNAMALPNGTILVGEDLLALVNEAELAAIIGHEIGHIEYGSFDPLIVIYTFGENDALFPKIRDGLDLAVSLCEGGMDEIEMDKVGLELAADVGYDPMAGVLVEQRLFDDGRKSKDFDWRASHPPRSLRQAHMASQARELARRERDPWGLPVYFRGRVGVETDWDGTVDPALIDACQDAPTSNALCGVSGHAPPGIGNDEWEQHRCLDRQRSARASECLKWREYAPSKELGCPGGVTVMCCPR